MRLNQILNLITKIMGRIVAHQKPTLIYVSFTLSYIVIKPMQAKKYKLKRIQKHHTNVTLPILLRKLKLKSENVTDQKTQLTLPTLILILLDT
jgi:hypothetical protein